MGNTRTKKRLGEKTRLRLQTEMNERFKNTIRRRNSRIKQREREAAFSTSQSPIENEGTRVAAEERSASIFAARLALTLHDQTCHKGIHYQKLVFEKLLSQPMLAQAVPDYVLRRKYLKDCETVCESLASAWKGLKYGYGKDHYLARNVLEAAVVGSDEVSLKAAMKCIGLNRRSVNRGVKRRELLDKKLFGEKWVVGDKLRRNDSLPESTIQLVVQWWTNETRVSPNRKDVVYKRYGRLLKKQHATHFLEESQLDFYTRFTAIHEDVRVGFTAFKKLKPWFVRKLKDFNSCCCKHHQEMSEIHDGFNNMRKFRVHNAMNQGAVCNCGCNALCSTPPNGSHGKGGVSCQAIFHTFKRATDLWETTLCPRKPNNPWHNLSCVKGECLRCGFQLIPLCDKELDPSTSVLMPWRRFEKVFAGFTKEGQRKEVIRLENKLTNPRTFLEYSMPVMKEFIFHNHVAQWQDKQYKFSLENLKVGEVMSLVDFAENYSFKGQNEIQTQHWFNFQCTILVHIVYTVNPYYNVEDKTSKRLLIEYFYYISDDKKHDNLFVQKCLALHWSEMKCRSFFPSRHIIWSDGCASQFKGARNFFHIARYPSLTMCGELPTGCMLEWHYWGTGHGKGPHDGAGACLKRCLLAEQLKTNGAILNNAHDVVQFLKNSMSMPHTAYSRARLDVKRNFIEIKEGDVLRQHGFNCKTVTGTRSMHCVRSISHNNNVLLECRDFTCFCEKCVLGIGEDCQSSAYVEPWRLITLEPCTTSDAQCENEFEEELIWETPGGDNHDLAFNLQVGDNYAVVADPTTGDGVPFFIMQCTQRMHVVTQDMPADAEGQSVSKGDEVVMGMYYKQQGTSKNSYILRREQGPCYSLSHLVVFSKFPMKLCTHKQKGKVSVYSISDASLDVIKSAIANPVNCASNSDEDTEYSDEEENNIDVE